MKKLLSFIAALSSCVCVFGIVAADPASSPPALETFPANNATSEIEITPAANGAATTGTSPTDGFHQIPDHFEVQHPYDLPASDRFSENDGVYTCWVYGHDEPHEPTSKTHARTEMRWETWAQQDHENQLEFDVKFDAATTKTCIFQIKSNLGHEALYLQVHDAGTLRNGVGPVFAKGMANKWFHVNASFNPAGGSKKLWINGVLVVNSTDGSPIRDWYFKIGCYSNGIAPDARSWAQFKNIKHWVK
jgi:hypothetical protein